MIAYSVERARHSKQAAFPLHICYVDYQLIGTHERQAPEAEKHIYDSILQIGYNGPPIAVFQAKADLLLETVGDNAQIDEDYGAIGVADGHHRLKAIQLLGRQGFLKDRLIPVQLIPVHNSEVIRIGTLSEAEKPLTIEEIEACFKEPNNIIPVCTSHFQTRLMNGQWARLRESQPDIIIKREDFIA